jgi:YggT family protein
VPVQILGQLIYVVLWIFLVLLFVRLVVDWVQFFARSWEPSGILLVVLEGVYTATDPPLKALRRVIPPLRLGGFALDLSFLLLIVIIYVLQALVVAIFGL